MRTPIWKTYIALASDDEAVVTDPPARVLEVMVIDGEAMCTLRSVDEHETVSPPEATLDADAETLNSVLRAGLETSPRKDDHR